MNDIEAEFQSSGVRRGAELYLHPPDAIRLMDRHREQGVVVLGIDGFLAVEGGVQPQLDHILDLSGFTGATWDEASSFLNAQLSTPLMFVVVPDRD